MAAAILDLKLTADNHRSMRKLAYYAQKRYMPQWAKVSGFQ
jgi:hypothetical protein